MGYTWVRGFIPGLHLGVDMGAPTGTPIHAIEGGRVVYAGDTRTDPHAPGWSYWQGARGAAGIATAIAVGNGRTELYAHQSQLEVSAGQSVAAGAEIGLVGATGNATGPHVHFAVMDGTLFRDPEAIFGRARLLAAVAGAGVVTASDPTTPPSAIPVPYGEWFKTVWKPALSPSLVITDALNASWAELVVEMYPQNKDSSSPLYWFDFYLDHVGADAATIQAFNDEVRARCLAAAAPYVGKTVGAAPDSLTVGLPGQTTAAGDLASAAINALVGAIGGAVWLAAILVVVILGLYLTLAPGGGGSS